MRFSERKGINKANNIIQIDSMSDELRNSIWNILYLFKWRLEGENSSNYFEIEDDLRGLCVYLWMVYFKQPADKRPQNPSDTINEIRKYFFSCKWYEVYDILEIILNHYKDEELNTGINNILERELSGYKYINGVFTNITNKDEVEMLSSTLQDDEYPTVKAHLTRALQLLSDRNNPDYRNSIKESISAVESMARIISGNAKATLSDALNIIKKSEKLHQALADGFIKLYGYTSDKGGIRHAILEEPNLTIHDAKYFLLSCTSFINYLKTKM